MTERIHYPLTFASSWNVPTPSRRPACGMNKSGEITDDAAKVTCRACLRSRYGPHADEREHQAERQRERAQAKAKDKREAERTVLAHHAAELEAELTLRALARIG